MAKILDHIPRTPLLDGVDHWPKSATRAQWFALTRDLIASTIAKMPLDNALKTHDRELKQESGVNG